MTGFGVFAVAASDPERIAVVDPDGGVASYGELVGSMHAQARGLQALGLTLGDTVAAVLPNSRELLELYGAAVETGLTFVAPNWHLGADELAYVLADSGARVLVADERFADVAREAADTAGIDERARFAMGSIAGFPKLDELSAECDRSPLRKTEPGKVMFYTSGTTGRPKGVSKRVPAETTDAPLALVTGIGLRASSFVALAAASIHDRVDLLCGPLYHAAPLAGACGALDNGALLVMLDKWTPEASLDRVERYRVTHVSMVPTMFHRLLALPDDVRARADVSSLQVVVACRRTLPDRREAADDRVVGPGPRGVLLVHGGAGTTVIARRSGCADQAPWADRRRACSCDRRRRRQRVRPGEPGLVYLSQATGGSSTTTTRRRRGQPPR